MQNIINKTKIIVHILIIYMNVEKGDNFDFNCNLIDYWFININILNDVKT